MHSMHIKGRTKSCQVIPIRSKDVCFMIKMDRTKLDLFNHRVAKTVIGNRRVNSDWAAAWYFAKDLLNIFPDSVDIKDEASLAAFYSGDYMKSAEIINDLLDLKPPRHMVSRVMSNKRFCTPYLIDKAKKSLIPMDEGYENEKIIGQLDYSPFIFVCMNTCPSTVENFLMYCTDAYLFSHFYYLYEKDDDLNMKDLPHYFECIKYNDTILNSLGDKCTPYIFNMVGDWLFFDKRNYVTIMRDIIDSAGNGTSYGQVLMNQNYSSSSVTEWSKEGIEKYTGMERRYYEDCTEFDGITPSLINREILYEYKFEDNYKSMYKTALMDGIHVVRRLTH